MLTKMERDMDSMIEQAKGLGIEDFRVQVWGMGMEMSSSLGG